MDKTKLVSLMVYTWKEYVSKGLKGQEISSRKGMEVVLDALEQANVVSITYDRELEGEYDLYLEQYQATGSCSEEQYLGRFKGGSFKEACLNWVSTLKQPEFFNEKELTYYGCRIMQFGVKND